MTLLACTLCCLVYLTTQSGVQGSAVLGHETVSVFLFSWIQKCHKQITKLGNWFSLNAIQEHGAMQPRSPYHLTFLMDHTKTLLSRAAEINNSTLGYSQPPFPFNILPGRVETRCQNFSGYALERCEMDVKTRTQLFITLVVILSAVVICTVLITMLTCMRRMKARRTVRPASMARKKTRQAKPPLIPDGKHTRGRKLGDRSSRRGINARQSLDGDAAVEAEEQGIEQGIDDQDIPVTLDGMTDGWMQWIRQRANMVCLRSFLYLAIY